MGKVVTSQGLTDFVQEGKFTNVPDHKPKEPPKAAETAKEPVKATPAPAKAEEPTKQPEVVEVDDEAEDENGLRPSDQEFSEKTRKRIQAKHRALNAARALAEENERFAEQQFNERKLAEKRAQEAEERAKALEAQVPQKPVEPELKAPSISDFKDAQGIVDWDKYTDAKADFAAKKAVADYEEKQTKERQQAEQSAAEARMKARFDAVRKEHPDFEELIEKVKGTEADQVPQHVLNYLFESEKGGELHYYLVKNPVETLRISKMKPILALAELGKLEDKLTKPPTANTGAEPVIRQERGGAPAPITPLSGEGTTGIVTDPAKMTYKQLREYERNRAREKSRH